MTYNQIAVSSGSGNNFTTDYDSGSGRHWNMAKMIFGGEGNFKEIKDDQRLPVSAGGITEEYQNAITIPGGTYASGDLIGSKFTATNFARVTAGSGIIQKVLIADKNKQNANLDLVLFKADPTATTFTDNAAFAIADADLSKLIGIVSVTDWKSFNDNSLGQILNLGMPYKIASGRDIYFAIVSRGTPTYGANDLVITVSLFQD